MADANRTGLAYYRETTPGVAQVTLAYQELRYTGESLNYNISSTKSAEIRSDRMTSDTIQVSKDCSGAINYELSIGTYDDFIKGAMMGTWAANVCINGTTRHTFTIERGHLDLTPAQYFGFKGMQVSSWTLNVASGAIVTGSFDFIGLSHTQGTPTFCTAATPWTSPGTATVLNAIGNVGTVKEGGSLLSGVYIQSISFTLNNNLRALKAIGSDATVMVGAGTCDITGQMSVYFTSAALYTKFLNATETSVEFTISPTGGAKSYVFKFPRVKYETMTMNATGIDTDVMQTFTWRALKDNVTGSMLHITRDITP